MHKTIHHITKLNKSKYRWMTKSEFRWNFGDYAKNAPTGRELDKFQMGNCRGLYKIRTFEANPQPPIT